MVRGAARLDLSQIDVLSQGEAKSAEKMREKRDFLRKLRDFQRQGKQKRLSIAKFAKKHGFTYKRVWSGLKTLGTRLGKLEQRLETLEKASNAVKLNGSAIHRSFKRPKLTVQSLNKLISSTRMRKKLEKHRFWSQIHAEMQQTDGEIMLTDSEWVQWFDELREIEEAVDEGRIIPRSALCFFKNSSWANRLFGRKV